MALARGGMNWGGSGLPRSETGTSMRVGISASMIDRGRGGVGQYLFALLRELMRARQHHFTLFVLEEDRPLFDFVQEEMVIVPVPETARQPVKNILWHQVALPQWARRLKLDLIHVPSYRRLLWSAPCPRVATIHDLAPFRVPDKYDWRRMFYGRVVARRLARRMERIITVSECTARDVKSFFGISQNRIRVVYNGLDHRRFYPGASPAARRGLDPRFGLERPFFLYVARLEHPAKNHIRLLAAFETFKGATGSDWELALAGSDWSGAEAIHEAIQRSPVSKSIRRLGFVPEEQLPGLYRAADVFVYPSLYEGFGMPPLEAMACGCPVICSTRGSLGEVVGDAAVTIDPEDVAELARQLGRLAGSSIERSCLRDAGLAQAQRFDWSRTAAETLEVYRQASLAARASE